MGATACSLLHIISCVWWGNFTFTSTMKFHTTAYSYVFIVRKSFLCNSISFSICTFQYLGICSFWKMNYTPTQSRAYSMADGMSILLSFLLKIHLQITNWEPRYPFTSLPNSHFQSNNSFNCNIISRTLKLLAASSEVQCCNVNTDEFTRTVWWRVA